MYIIQIVANDQTGLDVDKWDYFERDCHYIGMSNPFDWRYNMRQLYIHNNGTVLYALLYHAHYVEHCGVSLI